jgi:hypothetical protein
MKIKNIKKKYIDTADILIKKLSGYELERSLQNVYGGEHLHLKLK